MNYMLGIDQSTQGTKALLFDRDGQRVCRADIPHRQIINDKGWVEHDPMEIFNNTVQAVRDLVAKSGVRKEEILGLGLSSQRETAMAWDKDTGEPVYNAIVWQCARGEKICEELEKKGCAKLIRGKTGLRLSPYFSAAKIAWILQNVPGAKEKNQQGRLCIGTMDSWLIYRLTGNSVFQTDYSNASRTQLFNITDLKWDEEVCSLFDVNPACLAEVCDSDSCFGETDFDGFLGRKIPIAAAMGDSHGALFGQGCLSPGMTKATYGTGSSIMMNIGERPIFCDEGVVTSLAFGMHGKVSYVLEGNINYTGAVISWLKDDLELIRSPEEAEGLARAANREDCTYLIPAFSGLGAPYWDAEARAVLCGMSRITGKKEVVRAALDSVCYQIADVVGLMERAAGMKIEELRVDGGPTKNGYLMQFQSDLLNIPVRVPKSEELSGIGAAYAAGLSLGFYSGKKLFEGTERKCYTPEMEEAVRREKKAGWREALGMAVSR